MVDGVPDTSKGGKGEPVQQSRRGLNRRSSMMMAGLTPAQRRLVLKHRLLQVLDTLMHDLSGPARHLSYIEQCQGDMGLIALHYGRVQVRSRPRQRVGRPNRGCALSLIPSAAAPARSPSTTFCTASWLRSSARCQTRSAGARCTRWGRSAPGCGSWAS
jgi:hypothetical protein